MDRASIYMTKAFNSIVQFAEGLDETGWMILATSSVIAGYYLLKGPGIRGA